jgi:hypothetical protein
VYVCVCVDVWLCTCVGGCIGGGLGMYRGTWTCGEAVKMWVLCYV